MIRAAVSFVNQGLGTRHPGRPRGPRAARRAQRAGIDLDGARASRSTTRGCRTATPSTRNSSTSACSGRAILFRDCQRLINQDRNHFAAAMVALGDADAMVTGVTRNFSIALEEVRRVIDAEARPSRDRRLAGAGARAHRARRRHRRSPKCRRRGARRDRRSRPPAWRAASATSRASRCWPSRPSAIPQGERAERVQRGGARSSTRSGSISNMTARWRPTSRSTAS